VLIPKTHPRAASLYIREKLVQGFRNGLVVEEGLLAHGRGEMFDYLIGEKTTKTARKAIKAAARSLLTAKSPVISVNGNVVSLCAKEIVELSKVTSAKIEVNLFYASEKRKKGNSTDSEKKC
jgi:4-phosphopantoate--beta-alanine ligase